MKRINPIHLLIAFNIVVFLLKDFILGDELAASVGAGFETFLASLGAFGYVGIVGIYTVCSFFFIPLLIPLNILCGALYGPYYGTGISIVGITLGCIASTLSVRYVFKGMERVIDKRPTAQRVLAQIDEHGAVSVIAVRLAFVVPYLLQNIVLAVTSIGALRLAMLTLLGSLPGAAIYSFLGAGLVRSESLGQLSLYLAVPLALLIIVSLAVKRLKAADE